MTGYQGPNAKLAYEVLDYITLNPNKWDQWGWNDCFAGWACKLSGFTLSGGFTYGCIVDGQVEEIQQVAIRLLRFDPHDQSEEVVDVGDRVGLVKFEGEWVIVGSYTARTRDDLFHPALTLAEIEDIVLRNFGERPAREDATREAEPA